MIEQLHMNLEEIINNSKASIEKADLKILLPILADIKPKNILEIGTWHGYSIEIWYNAFRPKKLITIENNQEYLEFVRKRMLDGDFGYMNPAPTQISMDSHDERAVKFVKNILKNDLLDFLFIDGDHSYYGVQKDYEMYSPLVRSGGVIVFHDAMYHADRTEEVDEFWDRKIRKQKPARYLEIKASKNSTGIGVIWI